MSTMEIIELEGASIQWFKGSNSRLNPYDNHPYTGSSEERDAWTTGNEGFGTYPEELVEYYKLSKSTIR